MKVNLPLLITNGIFTHLDAMKDVEMERFISFLVLCSSGHDTVKDIVEPPWWLPDLPFVHPMQRPRKVTRKWRENLKALIRCCYQYHRLEVLLKLSTELDEHQRNNNLFLRKRKHTSMVYLKKENKLLVTIRNENMTYDKNEKFNFSMKCIMPKDYKTIVPTPVKQEKEPEKVPYIKLNKIVYPQPVISKQSFLTYLKLGSKDCSFVSADHVFLHTRKKINIYNSPHIPFSSQIGRRLIVKIKNKITQQQSHKRLERIERYLNKADDFVTSTNKHFRTMRTRSAHAQRWTHRYKFPTQTYMRKGSLNNIGMLLLNTCKPLSINVERMEFYPNFTAVETNSS